MDLDSSQALNSSQQVCGNRWEQTHCHTSWPAARLIMSRALSGNPIHFPEGQTRVDQQVYLALCG